MRPEFARAGVVVVPVLNGGGTRFKILEALALERPVISTPRGSEGLLVKDGVHLWIRELDDFAATITAALTDATEGRRLAQNGRSRVEELYSWDAVEGIIREAFGAPREVAPAEIESFCSSTAAGR
jgi:glycosyltransferase involved in cell wall biosynthesis